MQTGTGLSGQSGEHKTAGQFDTMHVHVHVYTVYVYMYVCSVQVVFRGAMIKSGATVPSPLSSHSLSAAQGLSSKSKTPTSTATGSQAS